MKTLYIINIIRFMHKSIMGEGGGGGAKLFVILGTSSGSAAPELHSFRNYTFHHSNYQSK